MCGHVNVLGESRHKLIQLKSLSSYQILPKAYLIIDYFFFLNSLSNTHSYLIMSFVS